MAERIASAIEADSASEAPSCAVSGETPCVRSSVSARKASGGVSARIGAGIASRIGAMLATCAGVRARRAALLALVTGLGLACGFGAPPMFPVQAWAQGAGEPSRTAGPASVKPDAEKAEKAKADDTLPPVVFRLRIVRAGKVSRLEMTATGPLEPTAFVLSDPNRAIVDLPEVVFQLQADAEARTAGRAAGRTIADGGDQAEPVSDLIQSYRFGLLGKGRSRVVMDLAAPATVGQVRSRRIAANVHRVQVDLRPADAEQFQAAAQAGRAIVAAAVDQASHAPDTMAGPAVRGEPIAIVIDPGHGGIDGGARAPDGTPEKDIVFAYAQELARRLRENDAYTVMLTRDGDEFVSLRDRVEFARKANAQLFISIHADSLNETWVSGATVYTMSDRASDAHAARLADKENAADARAGLATPRDREQVSDILFDLTRRETRAFSHVFANSLLAYWRKAGELNKNPHRSANFLVLQAPDVPSILLELGYLSNKGDARLLSDPEWRSRSAAAVARAIDSFFERRRPDGRRAEPTGRSGTSGRLAAGD